MRRLQALSTPMALRLVLGLLGTISLPLQFRFATLSSWTEDLDPSTFGSTTLYASQQPRLANVYVTDDSDHKQVCNDTQKSHGPFKAISYFPRNSYVDANYTQLYLEHAVTTQTAESNDGANVCVLEPNPYLAHFTHTTQQLLPCISHWIEREKSLVNSDATRDAPLLVIPDRKRVKWAFANNPFLVGIMTVLRERLGVQVMTIKEFTASPQNTTRSTFQMRQAGIENVYVVGDHLQEFVRMVQEHLHPDTAIRNQLDCSRPPRIAILNRKGTRRIMSSESLARRLSSVSYEHATDGGQTETKGQDVRVYEFEESFTFQQQADVFFDTDVLIAGHGAGLTSLMFLGNKPCSKVLELFPEGYFVPKYFGSLAVQSEVEHSFMYFSGEDVDMPTGDWYTGQTLKDRVQSRRANFCLSTDAFIDVVLHVVRDWYK